MSCNSYLYIKTLYIWLCFQQTDMNCIQSFQMYQKRSIKSKKNRCCVLPHHLFHSNYFVRLNYNTAMFVYVSALYLVISSFFPQVNSTNALVFASYSMSHILYLRLIEERWERFSSSGCHICYKTGVEQGVLMTWVLIKTACCVTRQIWPWNKPCDTSMITLYDNFVS